jgi:hypothetical protein
LLLDHSKQLHNRSIHASGCRAVHRGASKVIAMRHQP